MGSVCGCRNDLPMACHPRPVRGHPTTSLPLLPSIASPTTRRPTTTIPRTQLLQYYARQHRRRRSLPRSRDEVRTMAGVSDQALRQDSNMVPGTGLSRLTVIRTLDWRCRRMRRVLAEDDVSSSGERIVDGGETSDTCTSPSHADHPLSLLPSCAPSRTPRRQTEMQCTQGTEVAPCEEGGFCLEAMYRRPASKGTVPLR